MQPSVHTDHSKGAEYSERKKQAYQGNCTIKNIEKNVGTRLGAVYLDTVNKGNWSLSIKLR